MNSIYLMVPLAEQQLMQIELNEENTRTILGVVVDNNQNEIVRLAGATYLKT